MITRWTFGILISFTVSTYILADQSYFFPPQLLARYQDNLKYSQWAQSSRDAAVQNARPWLQFSDDQLWNFMFGPNITRAWMVWSDGYCPQCHAQVSMYDWLIDPLSIGMWKVKCPKCSQVFPTNDFGKFYHSGLDSFGVFDPNKADRSLLYNAEHPDPNDPLHMFGVDDGEGYVAQGHRWRFIGAYLIYGQWKQLVHGGIKRLSTAYIMTGQPEYAYKAAILLDRVADLYPEFDFMHQAVVYETSRHNGYVSVWHDAAEETREMAIAYDQVKSAIDNDVNLIEFLSAKAEAYHLRNRKNTAALIRENIENGILRDAVKNDFKISSNYPRTEVALVNIYCALGDAQSLQRAGALLDQMVEKATSVDGVTGEKGLAHYAAGDIHSLALLFEQFSRRDPNFLPMMFKKHPQLAKTWRFHIDTLCLQRYYPHIGDTGYFASPSEAEGGYVGVFPNLCKGIDPSLYSFLYRLYEITGDAAYVQAMFRANGYKADGLPRDIFGERETSFSSKVEKVIAQNGSQFKLPSINKSNWHLAILRSGEDREERALWISYDSGRQHGHFNCMNLGLFAKELDLMPDFGYAPVNYGGWSSTKATWYKSTMSHNTVVIEGKDQPITEGKTTLWAVGGPFQAIRVSCPEVAKGRQYERTAVMIDVSPSQFYVVDIFRVIGGHDHAKFMTSHFGTVTTTNLKLSGGHKFYDCNEMRNFQTDNRPGFPWSADWKIEDRYKLLSGNGGRDIHLRYTDLTPHASASILEGWIQAGKSNAGQKPEWVPRVMVRRTCQDGQLESTFVGIIEPYEDKPVIKKVRRLAIKDANGTEFGDSDAAIEITLADGRQDLVIAMDTENPLGHRPGYTQGKTVTVSDCGVKTSGELCVLRTKESQIEHVLVEPNTAQFTMNGQAEVLKKR